MSKHLAKGYCPNTFSWSFISCIFSPKPSSAVSDVLNVSILLIQHKP